MPYKLRYAFVVDYFPAGTGAVQPDALTPIDSASGAQIKKFFNTPGGQVVVGAGAGGILNAADVTALTNAAAADMAAQMNAAIGQLDGFVTGGG